MFSLLQIIQHWIKKEPIWTFSITLNKHKIIHKLGMQIKCIILLIQIIKLVNQISLLMFQQIKQKVTICKSLTMLILKTKMSQQITAIAWITKIMRKNIKIINQIINLINKPIIMCFKIKIFWMIKVKIIMNKILLLRIH